MAVRDEMTLRSDNVTKGVERAPNRSLFYAMGYTKEEREKLIDVIFKKFEETFGFGAKSVGSWMIDAHSLQYMSEKYGIEASCNCKDQWGTDGYTIWGGYWNQGYYPSRHNALCPAQSRDAQHRLLFQKGF